MSTGSFLRGQQRWLSYDTTDHFHSGQTATCGSTFKLCRKRIRWEEDMGMLCKIGGYSYRTGISPPLGVNDTSKA